MARYVLQALASLTVGFAAVAYFNQSEPIWTRLSCVLGIATAVSGVATVIEEDHYTFLDDED